MSTYSAVILADNPVGYWKLDEISGTVAADSSTNSNNGTIAGTPTMGANGLVFEPSGKCIDFDGVDDYVDLLDATNSTFDGASGHSLEVWFKTTSVARGELIAIPIDAGKTGVQIICAATGGLDVYARSVTGDAYVASLTTDTSFNDGAIHHVVFSINYAVGAWAVYIDDVLQELSVPTPTFANSSYTLGTPDTGYSLAIGSQLDNAGNFFDGKIQHAAIYNKALTPLQIRQHYQAGIAQGFHKEVLALNPTAYYPLNEATGDAIDWSGNDNNGTIAGDTAQSAAGLLGYDDSTAYLLSGANAEIAITPPASTTTYSLAALVSINSATGEYKILEDNTIGHWSIKDGKQNLNYSSADHLSTTVITAGTTHLVGLSVTAGAAVFYLDGIADGTAASALALNFENISDAVTAFHGTLQVVSISDTAWTAAQHRTLAQVSKTLIEDRGYPKVIKNLNPTGYWRLGEASGTTAFDESGNGNDGVINGSPTLATNDGALHQSKLKAMTFDGVDDYVGSIPAPALTFPFAFTAWVKTGAVPQVLPIVESHIGSPNYYGAYFSLNASNKITLRLGDGAGTSSSARSSFIGDSVIANSALTMVSVVVTSISVAALYINGTLDTQTTSGTASSMSTAPTDMQIGKNEANAEFAQVNIMEVAIISAALTAQQIKQIYEAGKSRYAAEVISYEPTGYWRGNEDSGTTMISYGSDAAADGTINGTPTMGVASSPLTNEPSHTSLTYDGTNDKVDIPVSLFQVSALGKKTLISWGKDITGVYKSLFNSGLAGDNHLLSINSNAAFVEGDGAQFQTAFYDPGVDGEFHFHTSVVDLTANTLEKRVDVSGTSSIALTGTNNISPTTYATIGSYSDVSDFSAGAISETAIFPTALTASQILDIYEMASYTSLETALTLFGIKGTLSETVAEDKWIARTSKRDDGLFLDSYSWDGTGFYNVLTNQYEGAVDVTILQDIGLEWDSGIAKVIGDRAYPTDAITNNFYFECTTAGTTDGSEPTWPASGTIIDGTVTWTWKGGLVRPLMHGPLKPILIA